eukprot:EC824829.1.p1 GENE.EC824829.1~~EC824829.1.p1  ORF type:complete len:137 (+),score=43.70 EC824829.1:260-670(+)
MKKKKDYSKICEYLNWESRLKEGIKILKKINTLKIENNNIIYEFPQKKSIYLIKMKNGQWSIIYECQIAKKNYFLCLQKIFGKKKNFIISIYENSSPQSPAKTELIKTFSKKEMIIHANSEYTVVVTPPSLEEIYT